MVLLSCNAATKTALKNDQFFDTNSYKQHFKDKVLCDCILAGLQGEDLPNDFNHQDKSFTSPEDFVLFDSLSKEIIKPVIKQIKSDSIKSLSTVAEAAAGKTVFKTCLLFYKSKSLDSIARINVKKWNTIENIDSLYQIINPSY